MNRRQPAVLAFAPAALLATALVGMDQTEKHRAAADETLRQHDAACTAQFANALRGNDFAPDRLHLRRVVAAIPRPDGRIECRADVLDMKNDSKPWDVPFRYPLPLQLTPEQRNAMVLDGCKREFDDAAQSRFNRFDLKYGRGFEIVEGQDFRGKQSYECRTTAVFPDQHLEAIFYHLMNDPLSPPLPQQAAAKPKPRPEPRGAARLWLD